MALVLKNTKYYFGGQDLSGDMNSMNLVYSAEIVDRTVFGSSFRKRLAGLKNLEITAAGFWDISTGAGLGSTEGKIDPVAWQAIGASSEVVSILPDGTALGNSAYFSKGIAGEYSPGGTIGDMMGYNFTAFGLGTLLVRGRVLEAGDLSTGITATNQNLGTANTATKKLYGALHMLSARITGDKINISVQGASESGFTSPSTMFEFLAATLTTDSPGNAYWKSTGIASTKHTYYRAAFNTSAGTTDSSFNAVLVVGIGPK